MLKNYLKIALRNLIKNKTFSLINILGLSFSLSICLLIILFLAKEFSYDTYHKNANSIYKIIDKKNNSGEIDYRVKDLILNNFPEVKNACLGHANNNYQTEITYSGKGYNIEGRLYADNAFFKIFSNSFIYGNSSTALKELNSVVLTEKSSKLIFGKENPLGKVILCYNKIPITISGVIKDFPDNSSMNAGIIVNGYNKDFRPSFVCGDYSDTNSHRYPFNIYLQLKENIDEKRFIENVNNHSEILHPYVSQIDLIPLKDMYLYDTTLGGNILKGNPDLLKLLIVIASIILILAVINYVNLTIAQQNKRNKETGIRKTIGASRRDITILFLTESVIISFIALVIALLLVEISLPLFERLFECNLNNGLLFQFPGNLLLLFSIIIVGVLAGIQPSLVFSSYNPIRVFRGDTFNRNKGYFRNILTAFQFIASIGLIFCVITVFKQIDFVKHKDLGFDKEQFLHINLPQGNSTAFIDKLKQYSAIKTISLTHGIPGSINNSLGSGVKGKNNLVSTITADTNFINTFNVQIVIGRNLQPGDYGKVCMINEAAYKYFEWDDLNDKRFNNWKEGGYEIIGVVNDFHFKSLHSAIEPLCIIFDNRWAYDANIKIAPGAISHTMEYLQKIWKESYPGHVLKYQFYDEWIDTLYKKEERFGKIVSLFAVLAISISCLGILGLAIFSSERRTKEIGVRKVLGASILSIIKLVLKELVILVVISNIIAWPLTYYFMNRWLEDFAYRIEITWWMFILSGGIVLVMALATVSIQAVKAATANPVKSLKYE